MKKLIVFLTTFMLAGAMMARQLTPDEALALALGKMKAAQSSTRAQIATINTSRASLTHTEMSGQDVPLLYVYDLVEGGFIIASADDRASGLLGYTDSGNFDGARQNPTFMAWLKDCRKALSHISSMPEQTRSTLGSTRALSTSVEPLLGDIKWDQNAPYNLLTPLREGYSLDKAELDTVNAPTGCVATAVAQVMKYYEWPVTGTGSHTNKNDSTQTIDFSRSTYQWSKMLPTYEGDESEESQMAVARLMSDVGCALDMYYGYNGSGSGDDNILRAMTNHFGYDKSMRLVYRLECSSEEWNDLLMTELNEKRPVIFGATTQYGSGHEFVVDGYDTNGLYHVNWGLSGSYNGYFDMNLMDPGIGRFTMAQVMTLGVKPDVDGTSVAKPDLVMIRHFYFDKEKQQWTYWIRNIGLGDFTGEVGIAIESPTGQITRQTSEKYDADPVGFFNVLKNSFDAPAAPGPGYKLYPYYCDVTDGEMMRIPAIYNSNATLYSVEKDGVYIWDYDDSEIADIKLGEVTVKHNFVGFAPQLNLSVTNNAASFKEYNGQISVDISTIENDEERTVCMGMAQTFINPGETEEIIVKCNIGGEKIVEGEYMYYIYFNIGGIDYKLGSASFEMVNIPPSNITYADFSLNKTEFLPDEELIASMTVANTGGYDEKTLAFVICRQSDHKTVETIKLKNADIEAESSKTFTLVRAINFGPGKYVGNFYVDDVKLEEATAFSFTVGDPTSLDQITTPDTPFDSRLYDLNGRIISADRKGIVIRDGKVYIIKE